MSGTNLAPRAGSGPTTTSSSNGTSEIQTNNTVRGSIVLDNPSKPNQNRYSERIPGIRTTKRPFLSDQQIARKLDQERVKLGLPLWVVEGTLPEPDNKGVVAWCQNTADSVANNLVDAGWAWAKASQDVASKVADTASTLTQAGLKLAKDAAALIPNGLPGAAAAPADDTVGTCPANEKCDANPLPAQPRTVGKLIEMTKELGFEITFSPSLQARMDRSPSPNGVTLDKTVAMIGDSNHPSKENLLNMEKIIQSNSKGANFVWLLVGSDDMLVEGPCDRWYSSDWNQRIPHGYNCKNIEEPQFSKEYRAGVDKMDDLAKAFLREHGQTWADDSSYGWYARHTQAGKLYSRLKNQGKLTTVAKDWDEAERNLRALVDSSQSRREAHFLKTVMDEIDPEQVTFFVPGDEHAKNIWPELSKNCDAVYIKSTG
jgi:hypothetical protein